MSMDIMNLVEEFYQIQAVEVFMAMNRTFVPFKHSHEKWMANYGTPIHKPIMALNGMPVTEIGRKSGTYVPDTPTGKLSGPP